jgi:myo-inositol catabolism protein IolC
VSDSRKIQQESPLAEPRAGSGDLFVLAFDHRNSIRPLFGIEGAPSAAERARIAAAKSLIFDGLLAAVPRLPAGARAGLLVDEEYGAAVLDRARGSAEITAAVAVERSGQREIRFEYGEEFGAHIERFEPELVKALVRYNVEGDAAMNERQRRRLLELSEWLSGRRPRLLFELLVPALPAQLAAVGGDPARYDAELRPELVRRAVTEIQDAGIEVATWKIEGIERREDCESIAAACRRDGRESGCLILGRGADEARVEHWLALAAPVPGFEGFAVGRTIWWDAIAAHLAGAADREATVATIADRYLHFVAAYREAETAG